MNDVSGYAAVVLRSMWRRASGRFPLMVIGLWVLVSVVSLFWTPRPLM